MKKYTKQEFADFLNVEEALLSYLESHDLLSGNHMEENGERLYRIEQAKQFQFILFLLDLGFSYEEIGSLIKEGHEIELLENLCDQSSKIKQEIQKLQQLHKEVEYRCAQIKTNASLLDLSIHTEQFDRQYLDTLPCEAGEKWFDFEEKNRNKNGFSKESGFLFQEEESKIVPSAYFIFTSYRKKTYLEKGVYLVGNLIGDTQMKRMYLLKKIDQYAKEHRLTLTQTGAFVCLNSFLAHDEREKIVQIRFRIQE